MRTEYHTLRQVGALAIRDSELSQSNMLQQLAAHQDKLAHEMNDRLAATMKANLMQAFFFRVKIRAKRILRHPLTLVPML